MRFRRIGGVAVKPGLTIAALALALAGVPAGAGASVPPDAVGHLPPSSGFPPAGAGAFSPSSLDRLPGLARKPDAVADETVAPPARRVVARADARQNAVVPVSYRIVPDAGAQRAPEPDGSALFLVGLLGVAAIARRRLMQ